MEVNGAFGNAGISIQGRVAHFAHWQLVLKCGGGVGERCVEQGWAMYTWIGSIITVSDVTVNSVMSIDVTTKAS